MTACAYICPPSFPDYPDGPVMSVLIADSLASTPGAEPLPFLPSTALLDEIDGAHTTAIFRKIFMFGDTAAAFSGNSGTISEVVSHLPSWLTLWKDQSPEHSMEHFHAKLLEIHEARGSESVRGFAVTPTSYGISYGGFGTLEVKLHHFGICSATGTGARDLLEFIQDHEIALNRGNTNRVRNGRAPYTVEEKVNGLINALNGRKMIREITRGSENAWGGYIEHARLEGKSWSLGESVLHLLLDWQDQPDERFTLNLIRSVGYDPFVLNGSILTMSPDGDTVLFNLEHLDQPPRIADIKHWRDWVPKQIHVSVRYNGDPDRVVFLPLPDKLRQFIHLQAYDDPFGLSLEFDDELGEQLSRRVDAMVSVMTGRPKGSTPMPE